MLPRSLTSRIIVAFVGLSAALLIGVSATLFLVLRDLHQQEIERRLETDVIAVAASIALEPAGDQQGQVQTWVTVAEKDLLRQMVDDGGFVLAQGPKGQVRILAGNPPATVMPSGAADNFVHRYKVGVQWYIYVEPIPKNTRNVTFVLALPDRSADMALSDLARPLLVIGLILLAVGIPIAWLLSRSITGPMRRLARAAADLPTSSVEKPVPLEGPTEVRVLTEHFNAMAHELAATRHEETQMLANLRHDLRTPLTSIGGYAEAIADGTASGKRAEAAARTIAEEAQRLERLVGELGVVERLRDGPAALRPEALDATAMINAAAARFQGRAAGQGVALEATGAAPGEPTLAFTGDRLAAERILQNLVDNALSVLPKGGHIWLRAATLNLPGRLPGISMSVTDDGPGFPPATTEKVFERFYRADPSRAGSGSGLGLAIVRELARAHGGEAWAENVAPHGARVTVMLPLVPVMAAIKAAEPKGQ